MYKIFYKTGKMQNVICTIATDKYFSSFKKYILKSWMLYAKKYNLVFKDNILYAFRNHDQLGRGSFNKTIFFNI